MPKKTTEAYARGLIRRRARAELVTADWGTCDANRLRDVIAMAGLASGAVRFGYTRDGGAYAIGIYGLGEPITEYVRPGEDLNAYLDDLRAAYEDAYNIGKTPAGS